MSDQQHAAMLLMGQGIMAAQSGQYDEALKVLSMAITILPNDGELYHNRGMVFLRLDRYSEAISDFNRAIALSPHPGSFEQRANAYLYSGNTEAAQLDWEQAVAIDPKSAIALGNLGHLCHLKREHKRALDYLDRAIEAEPDLAQLYATRASVYMDMGESAQAFSDMQKANYLIEHNYDTSDIDKIY